MGDYVIDDHTHCCMRGNVIRSSRTGRTVGDSVRRQFWHSSTTYDDIGGPGGEGAGRHRILGDLMLLATR